MAHSYAYLRRKAGLPEPTGFAAPDMTARKHLMFEVRRDDISRPMALFACESWAEQWISTLSQAPKNYHITLVDVEAK